ncbi:MAG: glycosyltransferase family 4 protein [Gemmataceae bacterium]|nr:glycosyltransferase family 4 protein [Gemmataceae bacterium]
MRILYLNPGGMLGGAERVLLSVLKAVRQARPEARLHLWCMEKGALLDRAAALGVDVEHLPASAMLAELGDSQLHVGATGPWWSLTRRLVTSGPALWSLADELRRRIRRLGPDLIHSNAIKSHLLLALAGAGRVGAGRAAVLWHVHDYCGRRRLAGRGLGWAASRARLAVAISASVAGDLERVAPRLPARVIHNAIDVDEFAPHGAIAPLDVLAGLPAVAAGTVRVGLVATFARWKGQPVFLEAAARLVHGGGGAPVRFYIIGAPIYRTANSQFSLEELQALAAARGLTGHVGFVDFQQDPAAAYRALDVVVHASTQPEPFGLTIVEAMACGRAVVATPCGGAAELIRPGCDALAAPPGHPEELARRLEDLIHDDELRRRLGAEAVRTVRERFNAGRLAAEWEDAYRACLFPSRSGTRGRLSRV